MPGAGSPAAACARHSPRNGFTVSFVLPGDRLVDTVTGEVTFANLTPAPRRQDHTTSPSASAPFVKSASASTASRPASVTIASRPSVGTGRNQNISESTRPSRETSENQKFARALRFCSGYLRGNPLRDQSWTVDLAQSIQLFMGQTAI
jgi:hypothetical protein